MSSELRSPIKLVSGNAHRLLSQKLADELNLPLIAAEIAAFADGEIHVHINADVRGAAVFIVQPTCNPVNDNLMVLLQLIDAARAAGAGGITAVVPYFGYARQEQRQRDGDARSAQIVARAFDAVGLDHLITLDLHAPALESAFPMPLTHLSAQDVLLPRVRDWQLENPVVVAPDAGGLKRAQRFAQALGAGMAVVAKDRPHPDMAVSLQVLGDVKDRVCVIVDDLASTGRTLAGAAEALKRAGAKQVHAAFTHAVMAPGALEKVAPVIDRFLTSDSIPCPAHPRLEVVSTAPQLAQAVRAIVGMQTV